MKIKCPNCGKYFESLENEDLNQHISEVANKIVDIKIAEFLDKIGKKMNEIKEPENWKTLSSNFGGQFVDITPKAICCKVV